MAPGVIACSSPAIARRTLAAVSCSQTGNYSGNNSPKR